MRQVYNSFLFFPHTHQNRRYRRYGSRHEIINSVAQQLFAAKCPCFVVVVIFSLPKQADTTWCQERLLIVPLLIHVERYGSPVYVFQFCVVAQNS